MVAEIGTAQRSSVAVDVILMILRRLLFSAIGLGILFALWWFGGWLLETNPATMSFADFGPFPTIDAVPYMVQSGTLLDASQASGYRMGIGLLLAIATGIPIGILMGRSNVFRKLSNTPFQFLRMVSPLSWEPIAVIEAMKMESPVESPVSGTIEALYIEERQAVDPGAPMLAVRCVS